MGSSNHNSDEHLGHILPQSIYRNILGVLLFLTIITVVVAQYDFGNMNIIVAMLIASVKAGLVASFFMHLKYETPLIWLYVFIPILLIFFLIGGVFIDEPYRTKGQVVGGKTPIEGDATVTQNKQQPAHH